MDKFIKESIDLALSTKDGVERRFCWRSVRRGFPKMSGRQWVKLRKKLQRENATKSV